MSGCSAVAAVAFLLLASSPMAGTPPPPTTTFDLTGVDGAVLAGVYTSPYYGSVGSSNVTIPVICDDFGDNSYIPEEWTTYVTSLSDVPTSGDDAYLKWSGASGNVDSYAWNLTSQNQAYTVAAILVLDILNSAPASQAQEDYSYALWELFDPSGASGNLNWGSTDGGVAPYLSGCCSGDLSTATVDVENAITASMNPNVLNGYNVTIYSYDAPPSGGGNNVVAGNGITPLCGSPLSQSCSTLPPQEFITVTAVPEASSLAEFAVYLLFGGAGLFFFGRRRILRGE